MGIRNIPDQFNIPYGFRRAEKILGPIGYAAWVHIDKLKRRVELHVDQEGVDERWAARKQVESDKNLNNYIRYLEKRLAKEGKFRS